MKIQNNMKAMKEKDHCFTWHSIYNKYKGPSRPAHEIYKYAVMRRPVTWNCFNQKHCMTPFKTNTISSIASVRNVLVFS